MIINSCTLTYNRLATLTNVAQSGSGTLQDHFETVDGFLPNCKANLLPAFLFLTNTILSLFISSISITKLNYMQR